MLHDACRALRVEHSPAQLVEFLNEHPSFSATATDAWELGALGVPVIETMSST